MLLYNSAKNIFRMLRFPVSFFVWHGLFIARVSLAWMHYYKIVLRNIIHFWVRKHGQQVVHATRNSWFKIMALSQSGGSVTFIVTIV